VAIEPTGNVVAVWLQADRNNAASVDLWSARFVLGKGWDDAKRQAVSAMHAVAMVRPSVAVDARGRAMVTWIEAGAVWIARFD
jgi:hypothetical protein